MLTILVMLLAAASPQAASSQAEAFTATDTSATQVATTATPAEAFLYGRVTTRRGVFEGRLRWDDEEASWNDMLDARKEDRPHLEHVPAEQLVVRGEREVLGMTFKHTHAVNTHRQFAIRFGHLRSLEVHSTHWTEAEMRDGRRLTLVGRGDLSATISVWTASPPATDASDGAPMEITMSRILSIEFLPTPADLVVEDTPIFGTVHLDGDESEVPAELLTGTITWDKDERLASDLIDGYTRGTEGERRQEHNIPFGDIASISRRDNASLVQLDDGTELLLRGTNDVNNDHRGVWINSALGVRTLVPWRSFARLDIQPEPESPGATYASFAGSGDDALRAVVTTVNGDSYRGELAFDVDEDALWDILSGDLGRLGLDIPFALIKSVQPQDAGSSVELWTGQVFELDGSSDVGDGNLGMVIYGDATHDTPRYVPWNEVTSVEFIAPAADALAPLSTTPD